MAYLQVDHQNWKAWMPDREEDAQRLFRAFLLPSVRELNLALVLLAPREQAPL